MLFLFTSIPARIAFIIMSAAADSRPGDSEPFRLSASVLRLSLHIFYIGWFLIFLSRKEHFSKFRLPIQATHFRTPQQKTNGNAAHSHLCLSTHPLVRLVKASAERRPVVEIVGPGVGFHRIAAVPSGVEPALGGLLHV